MVDKECGGGEWNVRAINECRMKEGRKGPKDGSTQRALFYKLDTFPFTATSFQIYEMHAPHKYASLFLIILLAQLAVSLLQY